MELPTMVMDRMDARAAFIEYRTAVHESLQKEADTWDERKRQALAERRAFDESVMAGYRQLSLGRRILDIERVMREAGENEKWLPRLAIARADETRINIARWRDGGFNLTGRSTRNNANHTDPRTLAAFRFGAGTLPTVLSNTVYAEAMVPLIPPRYRPAQLERYHLLWEAEWTNVPPVDPALLRALGNGLYVVLAIWELTEVERAVLGMARR
jgi:hypothetical protein